MTDKYIRLDDVMTIIARKHLFKDKTDFDKCIHTIAEQIKALDTIEVEPQEWISVKDRLPKESDEYYVSIRYECEDGRTFDNVTTSYFWAKEKMWKGSERMIGKILAWQPITEPSPYKGE